MTISGHDRATGRRNGGCKSVALAPASAPDTHPVSIHCKEDSICYTESLNEDGTVTHSLEFALERMDPSSRRTVEELCSGGVIATLETNNGTSLRIGWSRRFGARYPLRIVSAHGTTGAKLTDPSAETILLRSIDTEKSTHS